MQKRLIQIKQYLHYVFLYKQWKKNSTEENLVQLLNYVYRIKDEGSVASYPLFRELASGRVKDKKYLRFDNPNAIWKDNKQPLGLQEIERNFNSDMNSLNPLEETRVTVLPKTFQAKHADKRVGVLGNLKTSIPVRLRGVHYIVFQLNSNRQAAINIVNGLVKVRQYKTLRLAVYNYNENLNLEINAPILKEVLNPQKKSQVISLDKLSPGIYVAVIDDARNGFAVSFTGDLNFGVVADPQKPIWTLNRSNLYFVVRNKSHFLLKNDGVMTLISPKGRVIDLQKRKGLVEIQVEEGEIGIWQMKMQSGKFSLQDLDPLVSTSKEFLLRNEQ